MIFTYQETDIYYEDHGSGAAVVFLHGFTESSAIWQDFARKLMPAYRVVLIDLPGHGRSGCLSDIHDMSLMAGVVASVLDYLKIDKCALIGHSMGGYVALAFARLHPRRLSGLGLFHSTALADSEEARRNRDRAIEIIRQNHHGFLSGFIPSLFAPDNRKSLSKEIGELVADARNMTARGVIAAQQGMKLRQDNTAVLSELRVPVCFIAGHLDERIPLEGLAGQFLLPETAFVLLLRHSGHMGYLEAADDTFSFIKYFLSRCA